MTFWYVVTLVGVGLFLVGLGGSCLRRALLDGVRQDLYRLRARVFDRAIAKELELDDPSVSGLVNYVHALITVLEHLSFVHVAYVALRAPEPPPVPAWLEDERLKEEAQEALMLTCKGLLCVSLFVDIFAVLLFSVGGVAIFYGLGRRACSAVATWVGIDSGHSLPEPARVR